MDVGDAAGASGEYLEELTRILQEEDQGESFVWVYKIKHHPVHSMIGQMKIYRHFWLRYPGLLLNLMILRLLLPRYIFIREQEGFLIQ